MAFTLHKYDHDPGVRSFGLEAAGAPRLIDPDQAFKTLLVTADGDAEVSGGRRGSTYGITQTTLSVSWTPPSPTSRSVSGRWVAQHGVDSGDPVAPGGCDAARRARRRPGAVRHRG